MNYYSAAEIEGGQGWHFVSRNRREGTHPVGYCRDHAGHATAEQAEECFRQYLLDGARVVELVDWAGCAVCDEPTRQGLETRPPLGHSHPLCDEHRTPEQLAELTPVPHQIAASY